MRKVEIDNVIPGLILGQDIFETWYSREPMLKKGKVLSAKTISLLKQRGITCFFTKEPLGVEGEVGDISHQIENPFAVMNTSITKSRPAIEPKNKNAAIKAIKDLHISIAGVDEESVHTVVNEFEFIIERLSKDIPSSSASSVNVSAIKNETKYPYNYRHALSVSVISMAIGKFLNLWPNEIVELGKCAVLHDIGIFMIPDEILNKRGRLAITEVEQVQNHPFLGYSYLKRMDGISDITCEGILRHHEKLDGTGYPDGFPAKDIPLWSKIIAVADCYDAMTSARPYREAFGPADACEYIMGYTHTHFDYDVANALMRRVEFYPVGCFVELSDRNFAVVLNNDRSTLRPVVRTLRTNNIIDLCDIKYLTTTINRVIPHDEVMARVNKY